MSRPPAASLTTDPTIQALESRRAHARTRTRDQLIAWLVVVVVLGVLAWQVSEAFAILLGVAAAALGVAWDRWQAAVADDERIEQDLRALTTIYHQSPLTIRKWLRKDFILDSIRNLLAAALASEELAHGYHEQAVKQFIDESDRGFKSNWRYQIDLIDLAEDVALTYEGREVATLPKGDFRRLHTSVSYMQRVPEPAELYYVAAVFEGNELPAWFKKPNFLLREVVVVPDELIEELPEREITGLPDTYQPGPATELLAEPLADLARQVLNAHVFIGEQKLDPIALRVDRSSISWGFQLTEELQEQLKAETEISVALETFMSYRQYSFPVMMAAPTRHPIVQFNYSQTAIEAVDTHVFFSAERPWDARLRSAREELRRVDVLTEPDDWVFVGSGCIFTWTPQ